MLLVSKVINGPAEVVFAKVISPVMVTVAPLAAAMVMVFPDGTVKAVMMTAVQADKFAALATLLTVHVARLAVSVLDPCVILLGIATARATRAARRMKPGSEGIFEEYDRAPLGEAQTLLLQN